MRFKAALRGLSWALWTVMGLCMCAAASGGQRLERVGSSCIVDPPQHKKVTYLKMSAGLSLKNHIPTMNILFFSLNL